MSVADALEIRCTGLRSARLQHQRSRSIRMYVDRGTPLLLRGSNGVGKTALLRTICGLGLGRVVFLRGGVVSRPSISCCFDFYGFAPNMTVRMIRDDFARSFRWTADDTTAFKSMMECFGLGGLGPQRTAELSLGTRQLLRLALCLTTPADLYVLDEPFRAVDTERMRTLNELISLASRSGFVLLTAHHGAELLEASPQTRDLDEWLRKGGSE